MAAKVVNGRVDVRCDKCGIIAPPAEEIMAAHGLNRMGWHCYGGKHICPPCKDETHEQ